MPSKIFQQIFTTVDIALDTYIVTTVSQIINFLIPIFSSMMIIWIAIWGYLMILGRVSEPLQEGIFRIFKVGGIIALGLSISLYTDVVVNFLGKGPEQLSAVISNNAASSSANSLDNLYNKIFEVSNSAWEKGGVMNGNIGMYLIAIFVILIGGMLALFVAFLLLLSKIMLTILLGIGPLFIIMLLFKTTQRFFESWLSLIANYGILIILATAVGTLMVTLADNFITVMYRNSDSLTNLFDASLLCLVFGLCILVVRQIPSVASALGGGVALATQGAFGAAFNAMRPTSIRYAKQTLQREYNVSKNALATPHRLAQTGYAAYQKRFSKKS
ncbi:MAG: type IV secretion system protein [Pseudomonadota bacterium]